MTDSVEDIIGRIQEYCIGEEIEDDGSIVLAQDCTSLEAYNDNPMSYQYSEY